MQYYYLMTFLFKGSSGTTFSGLAAGPHMIVIQFIPDVTSQVHTLSPPLTFTISAEPPTPTPLPGDASVHLNCVNR